MIAVHAVVGLIIVVISVLLLIWNAIRIIGKLKGPSLRVVLMGLIDLQVLFGIVTFAIYPHWGTFLLHPITMVSAAVVVHTMTKNTRTPRAQLVGYLLTTVLLLAGVAFGNMR